MNERLLNPSSPPPCAPPLDAVLPPLTPPPTEALSFQDPHYESCIAPSAPPSVDAPPCPSEQLAIPSVTSDEARLLLESHAQSQCCLRRGYARRMRLDRFERSDVFHVHVESHIEERRLYPAFRPHHGELVDSRGVPPSPWDLPCAPPRGLFADAECDVPLPHSESLRPCHHCHGRGRTPCPHCDGEGIRQCDMCHGSGRTHLHVNMRDNTHPAASASASSSLGHRAHAKQESLCLHCTGTGRARCRECDGIGTHRCNVCEACGSLVHYTNVKIQHTCVSTRRALDTGDASRNLHTRYIDRAMGVPLWSEEAAKLAPAALTYPLRISAVISRYCDDAIREAHRKVGPGMHLHRERITVKGVPIQRGEYEHSKKQFWVIGTDHDVYAPGYPLHIGRISIAVLLGILLLACVALGVYFFARQSGPG